MIRSIGNNLNFVYGMKLEKNLVDLILNRQMNVVVVFGEKNVSKPYGRIYFDFMNISFYFLNSY